MNVVIGGGFAGLCAATKLADEGHPVTLVERLPHLGGSSLSPGSTPAPLFVWGHWRSALAFFERVGSARSLRVEPGLRLAFVDRDAGALRRSVFASRGSRLPAPLDRLGALSTFGALSLVERGLALRVLAALEAPNPLCPAALDAECADAWLARLGQSQNARRALWRPLAFAALRDDLRVASARMFEDALRAILLGPREDAWAAVIPPEARLGLRDDALALLRRRGATVRLGAPVESLRVKRDGDRVVVDGVRLADGEELPANAVIAAVSPDALRRLVPATMSQSDAYFGALARLRTAARITVRARLDREVSDHPAVGLLGSPFHRVFHRRGADGGEVWLESWNGDALLGLGDALQRLAHDELRAALPAAATARTLELSVAVERDAALAHPAGDDLGRPRARSPVEGLFVAGDFVRTSLPADLECAARSAEAAAMMAADYEPPPPPAGFIPVGRLLRRVPRGAVT